MAGEERLDDQHLRAGDCLRAVLHHEAADMRDALLDEALVGADEARQVHFRIEDTQVDNPCR